MQVKKRVNMLVLKREKLVDRFMIIVNMVKVKKNHWKKLQIITLKIMKPWKLRAQIIYIYVPDETRDEFKEDTGNSCEKKDSDSKQCQSCPKSAVPFHSLSEYNKHLKEIHTVFPGTYYPDKYPVGPYDEEMTENVKIETEEESFHEIIDDNSSVVTMVTALNNINNQQGYICSFCVKNIKTKSGHRRHELIHSDNDKKRRECHVCNKKFVDKFLFLGHMNTHIVKKPFKCEKCKLQYAYKASYKSIWKFVRLLQQKLSSVQFVLVYLREKMFYLTI